MQRRTLCLVGLLLLVAGATTAATMYRNYKRYRHWAVHEPGRLYRSGWMEPQAVREAVEAHKIRTVVNLCGSGEMPAGWRDGEREAATAAGAQVLELLMPFTDDARDPRLARHFEVLSDPENYPILVHCQHGVERTAMFLAIYDVVQNGKSPQTSLDAQPVFGRAGHSPIVRRFANDLERHRQELRTRFHTRPVIAAGRPTQSANAN